MGSHSYLMNLSCNNTGGGDITIGAGGSNNGEIINGSSNGCTGGNYYNSSTSSSSSSGGNIPRHLQNLVVFTGALTNEPSPVADPVVLPVADPVVLPTTEIVKPILKIDEYPFRRYALPLPIREPVLYI